MQPTISTSWSAINCKCLDGYSSSIFATCNIRCHISCRTCTGTAVNQCQTCYDGYVINTGTNRCDFDAAKATVGEIWTQGVANGNADIAMTAGYDGCGSFGALYGY